MKPAYHLSHLNYRGILTIDDLTIPQGVITCIIGESGSGKTTLLKMLNQLITPDSGTIDYNGRSLMDWDPIALRREAVMLAQSPVLFEGTIRDNLLIGFRFSEKTPPSETDLTGILELVHLKKSLDADSASLSGGEKQRVALAQVLLLHPPVLLLDEPSSALDVETTHNLMSRLAAHIRERQQTLIMVTHAPDVVREFADCVIEMKNGHIRRGGERRESR